MTTTPTPAPTPKAAVLRPSAIKSHDRGGGAATIPLVGPAVGAQAFINGITRFGPGTRIPFHSHNCEESVMLLEGDLAAARALASLSQPVGHAADEDPVDLRAARRHAHDHRDRRDELRLRGTCQVTSITEEPI
jgi:hypothetical protein